MLNFALVGERFSELRNRSGFTQKQLAEYLDVEIKRDGSFWL